MSLLCLAATYRDLSLDVLDQLSAGARSTNVAAHAACPALRGVVTLATCNRFEVYLDVDAPDPSTMDDACWQIARLVAAGSRLDTRLVADALRRREGEAVSRHLFAVAAGLESMAVGEREIGGQVKRALAEARDARTVSGMLERLFAAAAHTSKRVFSETTLGAAGRSLVAVGLDAAAVHLPRWGDVRVLLIGTGAYAGASLAALRERGCVRVSVHSASGRAREFAASHGVDVSADLAAELESADLVVACSGVASGAGYLVGPAQFTTRDAGVVVLDLALHRDVDPAVGDLPGVVLYDLAELGRNVPAVVGTAVAQARGIVADAARAFEEDRLGRTADETIKALLAAADVRIDHEVARLSGPDADVAALRRSVRRRVRAELYPQIVQARAEAVAAARVPVVAPAAYEQPLVEPHPSHT
ncbi:MAG: glutamyl-tRNA reductase [Actinomycetia bacterium]|nr:glutamyl-tRNA reductase [Actinomycetes bacterium]